jgi:predicted membrane channel-forming protein YqfA (hemolysin III family)
MWTAIILVTLYVVSVLLCCVINILYEVIKTKNNEFHTFNVGYVWLDIITSFVPIVNMFISVNRVGELFNLNCKLSEAITKLIRGTK